MSFSFQHSGGSLPITIPLGESSASASCPSCERSGKEGVVTVLVRDDAASGTSTAMCDNGHMVMVAWSRDGAS